MPVVLGVPPGVRKHRQIQRIHDLLHSRMFQSKLRALP